MATSTKAVKNEKTATVVEPIAQFAVINPGEAKKIGKYTIENRGNMPVKVSQGAKDGFRYSVNDYPITQIMRWAGANGWKFDGTRAVLCLMGLGECVNDNTVTCQLSSGRRSAEWKSNQTGEPHHGFAPELDAETIAALKKMAIATAEVAAKGKEMRRAGTIELQQGKKKVQVPFDWRLGFATQFAVSESGSLSAKKKPSKKAK